jgi:hypothetical protein
MSLRMWNPLPQITKISRILVDQAAVFERLAAKIDEQRHFLFGGGKVVNGLRGVRVCQTRGVCGV